MFQHGVLPISQHHVCVVHLNMQTSKTWFKPNSFYYNSKYNVAVNSRCEISTLKKGCATTNPAYFVPIGHCVIVG